MAKYKIFFKDCIHDDSLISVKENQGKIKIQIDSLDDFFKVSDSTIIELDKSTAIKFAKTLRTEINKIKESEVSNG